MLIGQGIHMVPKETAGKVQKIQGQEDHDDNSWTKTAQVPKAQEMVSQWWVAAGGEAMAFWDDHFKWAVSEFFGRETQNCWAMGCWCEEKSDTFPEKEFPW